jgi:uncharacterized protein (TIGR01777 family)
MNIAISGSTGLIGTTLKNYFLRNGHQVSEITRHPGRSKKFSRIYFDPKKNYIDAESLEGHDVIIHLAGANIAGQRWTDSYKKEILESRIQSTKLLVNTITKMNNRPKIFLCASAVGYYGNRDPQVPVNERSNAGHGFLPEVCHEWENASADLILLGVRLVYMRFGVVLSKKGGALAKMLMPFYAGVGGKLGSGKQKMSWIALDEISSIVDFILSHDEISGPVNFVSPNPVTNKEFTKALGKVIHRLTILPMPAFAVRLLFGEMGQSLLLEGCHAVPEILQKHGYQFLYPTIETALQQVIRGRRST